MSVVEVPAILRDFIASSYSPAELHRLDQGCWGSRPGAEDGIVFVTDFLQRPAFWEQMGTVFLRDDQKIALAQWVANSAPNGIREYREAFEQEHYRFAREENERVIAMIQTYFPQAYTLIFGQ